MPDNVIISKIENQISLQVIIIFRIRKIEQKNLMTRNLVREITTNILQCIVIIKMARPLKKVIFDLETSGKIIRTSSTFQAFFVLITFIIMALVSSYYKNLCKMLQESLSTSFQFVDNIFNIYLYILGSVCFKWLVYHQAKLKDINVLRILISSMHNIL